MFTIRFEGTGKTYEASEPISVYEAANSLELADRSVLAAKLGDKTVALSAVLDGD